MSALADNAVLIVAIAFLLSLQSPDWMTPFLKFFFTLSYVVFAFGVGALADAFPKRQVMMVANALKILGCIGLSVGIHPLWAYGLIGMGAAAYSPAKYGLLVEILPAAQLVRANAWLEGLTIAAVILGTLIGGILISSELHLSPNQALYNTGALYAVAAFFNLFIPNSHQYHASSLHRPLSLWPRFVRALGLLTRDPVGRVSLSVTTLLWGVGAVLQFVILDWGQEGLGLSLDRASMLQGIVAVGVALGAILAARCVRLDQTLGLLPFGILLGPLVAALLPFEQWPIAAGFMLLVGAMAGFFVVPMNALLQHRGYVLVNAGQSIAVQNFCENLCILVMLAIYAALRALDWPLWWIIILFALFVSASMCVIWRWHCTAQAGAKG